MGAKTEILWTDATFNPWWGCTKISEACEHCYAETWAKRCGWDTFGSDRQRRFFKEAHWNEPHRWNRNAQLEGRRTKVFCGSMCDVFEDGSELNPVRQSLWRLIEETAYLDWLLLTKRPENALRMVPEGWRWIWPQNIWFGFTAENQENFDRRQVYAADIPCRIRFVSFEPLLGPIYCRDFRTLKISWAIVGGESGSHARLMHPDWARSVVRQCKSAGVACFVKQVSVNGKISKNMDEWPSDLQIREFPNATKTVEIAAGKSETQG